MTSEVLSVCDTGECLQVEITGDKVRLWESTLPGIEVITTLASWRQWQDKARGEERARIAAWLRDTDGLRRQLDLNPGAGWGYAANKIAHALDRGEFDDVAAGDE